MTFRRVNHIFRHFAATFSSAHDCGLLQIEVVRLLHLVLKGVLQLAAQHALQDIDVKFLETSKKPLLERVFADDDGQEVDDLAEKHILMLKVKVLRDIR